MSKRQQAKILNVCLSLEISKKSNIKTNKRERIKLLHKELEKKKENVNKLFKIMQLHLVL